MAIGGTGAAGIGGAGGSPVPPPSPPGTGGMQVTTPVPTQPPVGTAGMGVAGMSAPTPIVPVTVPATVPSIAQMQGSHDSSASCSVKAGGGNPVGMWLLLGLTGMLVQRRRRVV
jgi:MYXO-CTERM domain-containing protein